MTVPEISFGMTYERVNVTPDTPEWEDERRRTLGASEVPAVLGLSPYASPLDVYRSKHGVDRPFDPELSFIGHAEEVVIGKWLRAFHPELGQLRRGYMARSLPHPWLHSSFDRFLLKRGTWTPVQMKTAHQYASGAWEDGQTPLPVQVQVQTELLVSGAPYGYAVAFVGGRRFEIRRLDRDDEFLQDVLLPQTERFWTDHVVARVPPDPVSMAEAVELWPGSSGAVLQADEELRAYVESLRLAQQAAKETEAVIDTLKLEIQKQMQNATDLLGPDGRTLVTWRPRAGARRLDAAALRADHPDLADAYTRAGTPTRTFRVVPARGTEDE